VAAGYWWGRRHDAKPRHPPQTLPTNVNQQLSGYTFTRSDEGRQIFTVHAARTVAFKEGGATVLEEVLVEVFGRTGKRRDILRTRRCDYNTQTGDLFSAGRVEIELNAQAQGTATEGERGRQQVLLETSRVYFRQQGSLVVSDEPVRFRVGRLSGSAQGLAYATKEGWVELKKEVRAELMPSAGVAPQLPLRLTASRVRYDKEKGEVTVAGPLEFSQGNRRLQAGRGLVVLNAQNRITRVVLEEGTRALAISEKGQLRGSAQRICGEFDPASEQLRAVTAEGEVQLESQGEGSTSRLEAEQVEVAFAGAHPQAQSGSAAGNVRFSTESYRAASRGATARVSPEGTRREKKELTAGAVRFTFQSAGQSLKQAETVGAGKLVLVPPDPGVGERVITAGQFLVYFDARNRLERLRGIAGTRILFRPASNAPAGSLAQESSAERLEAVFDTTTQTIRAVRQEGSFQFREGDRQAAAEQASYEAETETLTLTGHPRLWDLETEVRAEEFVLDLHTDTAEGSGKVQSTHVGTPRGEGGRSDPTNVLADRVVAERRSQFVHYEGNVRAWHGTDVVESSALDVYRTERRVSSGRQVRSAHLQSARLVAGSTGVSQTKGEARPVIICAERLEYFDAGRRARYAGNVRLQTEQTTLEAERLDVYFSDSASVEQTELERAVAEGQVRVVQPGRRAAGNRAEYFAGEGRIVLSGGPPSLYDAEKGFTTGQRLTFFIHDDTLRVDGGDESPTLSRHRIAQ
jgi:lipopolysaccharide export system protein LptA